MLGKAAYKRSKHWWLVYVWGNYSAKWAKWPVRRDQGHLATKRFIHLDWGLERWYGIPSVEPRDLGLPKLMKIMHRAYIVPTGAYAPRPRDFPETRGFNIPYTNSYHPYLKLQPYLELLQLYRATRL